MTASGGRGIHDRDAQGSVVQLGFDGTEVSHKLGHFRDSMRRSGTRQVPVGALKDVCALGYAGIPGELSPEHLPRVDAFSDKLTAVLVGAGTFRVLANWAKVRRAQAAGQQHIEVVDVVCDAGDEWWALLAEIREIKQRDWARRLHFGLRHLPEDVRGSLSLREWEAALGVDHTSLSWLRKPLPAYLEAEVFAGRLSIWAAYQQTPKSFWAELANDAPCIDEALPETVAGDDAYDAPATVRGAIERAGLGEYVRLARCVRSPQRFFDGVRTLWTELERLSPAPKPSRLKGAASRR